MRFAVTASPLTPQTGCTVFIYYNLVTAWLGPERGFLVLN